MASEPEERENKKTVKLYAKIVKELLEGKRFTVIFGCDELETDKIKDYFFTDQKLEGVFLFAPTEVDRSYIKLTDPQATKLTEMQFFVGLIIYPEEKVITFKQFDSKDNFGDSVYFYFHLALQNKEEVSAEIWQKAKTQVEEKEIYFEE